jgi:hypothetical protein
MHFRHFNRFHIQLCRITSRHAAHMKYFVLPLINIFSIIIIFITEFRQFTACKVNL